MKTQTKTKQYLIPILAMALILLGVAVSVGSPAIHSDGVTEGASPDDLEGKQRLAEGIGFSDPAATYCEEMGYEYRVVKTEDGERGIATLPDGRECDAWAFYRGECGEEFSYCAQNGWPVAKIAGADSFAGQCTTCVLPDGSHKTVSNLLNLNAKSTLGTGIFDGNTMIADMEADEAVVQLGDVSLPSHFDWRDNGGNWMTPVKSQGGCGSCWAFAAVGAVEAQHNIASGDPGLDLDLSEQYLVSDCCTNGGDCGGGWPVSALTFIRDEGITDEACFPYTARNGPCSDRCADWSSRLNYIDERGYVPSDVEAIKGYLIDKGPLVVCLGVGSGYGAYWDNGIYRCTQDSGVNHAVVLVGYDETQNYWIAKNSWGSGWNGDGYFKVGCGECSIENYVHYNIASSALPIPTPMPTPTPMPPPTPTPTPTPMPTPTPTPTPTPNPTPDTSIAIDSANASEGETADVDITIVTDDPDGIGSATITLTYDCSIVSVDGVSGGEMGNVYWGTEGCTTTMTVATGNTPGPTGAILFAKVHLNVEGSSGECGDLDIEASSMYDGTVGDPQQIIPSQVTDCTFCISGLEGDVNNDGVIDAADIQLMAQHIVGTITLDGDYLLAADVNCDGKVDSADMQLIAQYLVGTIDYFPY